VKPHGSHALTRIVIDSFTAVPDLRLGEKSSTRQTFQVFLNLEGLTGSVLGRRDLSIRMIVNVGYEKNLRLTCFRAFRAFRGHCVTSVKNRIGNPEVGEH
jgi:hypothetical protein